MEKKILYYLIYINPYPFNNAIIEEMSLEEWDDKSREGIRVNFQFFFS
ncbi:MAG TPA: hypothetical protein VFK40_09220 [Nitrososphaeraceae archaeon]|nr:hypothetical protein [Nitrososphaeraceae archaeon]